MISMFRALILGMLVLAMPQASGQTQSILHIKVVLVDAEQKPTPVPRHALLISDNPASAPPRLIVTGLDGTADVRLRPGSYTVESDKPVAFNGKAYQWTQMVQVAAGKEASLELTAANAEVGDVDTASMPAGATTDTDPSFLLTTWRDSVVALWTPTTRASGFVIDARGFIATNQRVIGSSISVEVQLTPEVKVGATVLATDPTRDIAILWIDPKAIASVKPLHIPCGQAAKPAIESGEEIYTIGVPLRQAKGMTYGTVTRVEPTGLGSDLRPPRGSAGGPVFVAAGDLIGLTSPAEEDEQTSRGDVRVVRTDGACEVLAAAEKKMKGAAPPSAAHLPVEPSRPFPPDALKAAAERRAGSLNPYQIASASFDISFITPVMTFGTQYQAEQGRRRTTSKDTRTANPEPLFVRAVMDFANWSEYVWDFPPVLLIRATPKFEEGFWTKVGRAAAQTQGIAIPAIKRFKSGFSRMRAYCGETELTPIHPFKLERKVSETDSIYEGLYAFDPGALGPHCASVRLVLFTEKEPDKADPKVVDAKVIEQIWQDFASYRR
jgi:S1-C subfamily serine protease